MTHKNRYSKWIATYLLYYTLINIVRGREVHSKQILTLDSFTPIKYEKMMRGSKKFDATKCVSIVILDVQF